MATDLAVEAAGNFLLQMSQPYDARLYLNNQHPQCALDGPGCIACLSTISKRAYNCSVSL